MDNKQNAIVKWKEWIMYIITFLLLMVICDWGGLLDGSELLPKGEFYDFIFALIVLVWLSWAIKNRKTLSMQFIDKKMLLPVALLLIYCSISGTICILSGTQGTVSTILVLREMYYIVIFLPFLFWNYDINKMLRVLLVVDIFGSIVKTLEVFTGPLTVYHVQGIYETTTVGMWRCYSEVPLMTYFLCPLLIYGILQKRYIFNKWLDIVACLILFMGRFFDMSRMAMFALLFVCSVAYIFGKGSSVKSIMTQVRNLCILGVILFGLLLALFPNVVMRFVNGVRELFHLYGDDYTSEFNFAYRTGTMIDRWEYLKQHGRLLFGFGPLHNDLDIWIGDRGGPINGGVVAPDTAYGTFLFRFGCIGLIIIIILLLWFAIVMLRQRGVVGKSVGLLVIGDMINGICEHPCLAFSSFLVIGIVLGIAMKEKIVNDAEIKVDRSNAPGEIS